MVIIDSHAHVFPQIGTDSGGQSAERQLKFIQHHVQFHVQGWRRLRDGSRAEPALLMPRGDAIGVDMAVLQHDHSYGV